jgi:hypothetical protein
MPDTKASDTDSMIHTTDLSFAYTTSHLVRRRRPESELFLLFPSSSPHMPKLQQQQQSPQQQQQQSPQLQQQQQQPFTHRRRRRSSEAMVTQNVPLETYAIPDISDRGAYLLYSPRRWKSHLRPSHSIINININNNTKK